MNNPEKIAEKFAISGEVKSIEPLGKGNINDSFVVKTADGKAYAFQRINTDVFKNPDELMSNVVRVTGHIRKKLAEEGKDPVKGTLNFIPAENGEYTYKCDEGVFRMYDFVDGVVTIQQSSSCEDAYNTGFAFGKFQGYLADFDAASLFETIPDFHHTPKRVETFRRAVKDDVCGRAAEVSELIEKFEKLSVYADKITNSLEAGIIPVRVTHNDTKINNILFDSKTGEGVCIIDLDTVMPASVLYDFGDMIRTGAAMTEEDDPDLSKVGLNLDYYRSFVDGFIAGTEGNLIKEEIELMAVSAIIMTYECGIRFLTDYLSGDTYFAVRREGHNLDRAANQMKLALDMIEKFDDMLDAQKKYLV